MCFYYIDKNVKKCKIIIRVDRVEEMYYGKT